MLPDTQSLHYRGSAIIRTCGQTLVPHSKQSTVTSPTLEN